MEHSYLGVTFESVQDVNTGGYYCTLGGIKVTGTDAKTRVQANMAMTLMLEQMQDQESKPMSEGDVIQYVDNEGQFQTKMITNISELIIGVCDLEGNVRGTSNTFANNQAPIVLASLNNVTEAREKLEHYEWVGTMSVEMRAFNDDGTSFTYLREVSMWCEPGVFEARVIHEAAKHGENSPS